MENTTTTITQSRTTIDQHPRSPWNLLSLVPKLDINFPKLSLPGHIHEQGVPAKEERNGSSEGSQKPDVVKLAAEPKPATPYPLKLEIDDDPAKISNPLVAFPVYALGGFIFLKWVWARWQERKERAKKASTGDERPPDEYQYPGDENE